MARVTFALTLDQTGVPPSVARLWVDSSGDDHLHPGEELVLGTADGLQWVGAVDLEPVAGTLFLLKFVAPLGTKWTFVASDGANVRHNTHDQTITVKEQLVGRLQ